MDATFMPSVSLSALPLAMTSVASEGALPGVAAGKDEQLESTFAALLRGKEELAPAGDEMVATPPGPMLDGKIFEVGLPPFAAIGKTLPATGKDAVEGTLGEAASDSPIGEIPSQAGSLAALSIVPGGFEVQRMPESVASAAVPNAGSRSFAETLPPVAVITMEPMALSDTARDAVVKSMVPAEPTPTDPHLSATRGALVPEPVTTSQPAEIGRAHV